MKLRGKLSHGWYTCENKEAVVSLLNEQVDGRPVYYMDFYKNGPIGVARTVGDQVEFELIKSEDNDKLIERLSSNPELFELAPSFIYDFEGERTGDWQDIKLMSVSLSKCGHGHDKDGADLINCPLTIVLEAKNG